MKYTFLEEEDYFWITTSTGERRFGTTWEGMGKVLIFLAAQGWAADEREETEALDAWTETVLAEICHVGDA